MLCIVTMTLKGDYERYQWSYCTKPMLCIVTQKEIMRDPQSSYAEYANVMYRDSKGPLK